MEELPVFRASKKRKLARQRHDAVSEAPFPLSAQETPNERLLSDHEDTTHLEDRSGEEAAISNVVRSRRQKARQGVKFSNDNSARDNENSVLSMALVESSGSAMTEDPLKDISSRFTTSTGQVIDVDQHMMEYIDSQLARRDASSNQKLAVDKKHKPSQTSGTAESSDEHEDGYSDSSQEESNNNDNQQQLAVPTTTQRSSATIPTHNQPNHLAEVSLANLPLMSTHNRQTTTARPSRPRKPRLGRDGKPLRPRPRKRANSADQARDRLVEQILAENKPDTITTYGPSGSTLTNGTANERVKGTNEDADERMAAEFQRQFMEGVAERRARQQQQQQQTQHGSSSSAAGAGKKSNAAGVLDGPKLGGSRSARAKMQAALMAEKEKERDAKR